MKKRKVAVAMALMMAATQFQGVGYTFQIGTVQAAELDGSILVIPDGTTRIATYQYQNRTDITKVVIPDSVTCIGYGAFSGCTNLTTIELPDTVKSIEPKAFANCTSIQTILLPNQVEMLWNETFAGCTKLEEVVLSEELTQICPQAFANCTALTDIIIPKTVEKIGNAAFTGCKNLKNITFKGATPEIVQQRMDDGSLLYTMDIAKDAVFTVPTGAMEAYRSLLTKPIYFLSQDIQIIEEEGNEVSQTPLPSGSNDVLPAIEVITITLEEGRTFVNSFRFRDRIDIEKVVFTDTYKEVGYSSFQGCIYLADMEFPQSLEAIYTRAFKDCKSLKELVIPENVSVIDQGAFDGCTGLKNLTFKGMIPPEFQEPTDAGLKTLGIAENAVVTVPRGALEVYEAALRQEKVGLPASATIVEAEELVSSPQPVEPTTTPIAEPQPVEPTATPIAEPQPVEPTATPMAEPQPVEPTATPIAEPQPVEPTATPIAEPQPVEPTATPIAEPQPIETPDTTKSKETTVVKQTKAQLKVALPKVLKFKKNTKLVKGTAQASSKVYVKVGSKQYKGTVAKNGTFIVKTCKLKKGQKVKVYIKNAAGVKSKVKTVTIK